MTSPSTKKPFSSVPKRRKERISIVIFTGTLQLDSVAAPGRQGSQVISRSENPQARSLDALFFSKKLTTFLVVALETKAANAADCFTVKIKPIYC